MMRTGVVLVLALAAGAAAAQQLYRWTDERGRLHVADTPPPPGAKDVHQWRVTASSAAEGGSEPYALRQARKESRSEEHTSELQSRLHLVCRLLLEKKKKTTTTAS